MKPAECIALLVTAAALACATRAGTAAPAPAAPALAPASEVRLVTLSNGLRLLLAPDTTSTAVDVAVWYRAGAVHERAGRTGISHLFEHLMFGGSGRYGPREHERLVQAEGGAASGYTTPDYACYYQTIPPAALDLVLGLEADRIATLRLEAGALEAGKRAVREENRRQVETQPVVRALQDLFRLAWPAHPYGQPLGGLDEDLARISLADCQAYHAERYAPNNAVVSIVGRFDRDQALQAAKRWLEPLQRRRVVAAAAAPGPPQKSEQRACGRLDLPFSMLLVGWKTPGHADPDSPALALLARIVSNGPASRLQRALLGDSLGCLSVHGTLDSRRDGGLLYAMATLQPGADSASIERTFIGAVERLAWGPVSGEELDRARRQEQISTLFGWQTPRGCAEALGAALLVDGDWRAAALRLERLRRLTPVDLQRAAARVLVARGRNVLWVVPGQPPGAVPGGTGGGSGSGVPPAEGGR